MKILEQLDDLRSEIIKAKQASDEAWKIVEGLEHNALIVQYRELRDRWWEASSKHERLNTALKSLEALLP